ncbi:C40 family peptidase [Paenibacillus sediminis]|uniref:Cell wall-associated NlpC family hydrolase n=1 Tax=Paenibacillus sediminis TaxID=664909 RepID=A0ABS4H1C9_9BACL|nr:C40 family peptidase [Paenibacillus sediminis]MBP1935920.1 cell wall-associated NlpC family hydrolase [Paenibacillus sediminis]
MFKLILKKVVAVGLSVAIGLSGVMVIESGVHKAAAADSTSTTTLADSIINYGESFMGTPYKFGASTKTTSVFDCSSFMKHIYGKFGIELPRSSVEQSKTGYAVSKANLKKGDLVFFSSGSRANGSNVTHVAMYIGDGKILHTYGAPGVTISDLNSGTWKRTYLKARRVL